jgi:ubiquinone/menaquinone biosynthesis C-methylase UbiE
LRPLHPGPDVSDTFDVVARAYDTQVGLNPGYHANLRAAAAALLGALATADRTGSVTEGLRILDIGCGSGASTRALVEALGGRPARVLGVDASAGMLAQARAKGWPAGVEFACAPAEALAEDPATAGPFDAVLAAYLVRNVPDRDAVIATLAASLAPGGVLAVHDYSVRGNPFGAVVWTLVCWTVVIPLGWLTARHTRLYRYLWRSALGFDSIPRLSVRLRDAGLEVVSVLPGSGWQRGILHTVLARRPEVHR